MGIKDFFDKLDVSKHGYRVNKFLTNSAFVLLVLLLIVVGLVDGWGSLLGDSWVECPAGAVGGRCLNPLYTESFSFGLVGSNLTSNVTVSVPVLDSRGEPVDCELFKCEEQYLEAGEVLGYKPSWLARNFNWLAVLVVFAGLLLNHYLYNKGFFKKRKLLKVKENEK